MNNLIRKSATPFGALAVAVLSLIVMAIISISGVTHAVSGSGSQAGRLITIHDRGTERVILSQATTVGDALSEAGIVVDSKDVVEPAVSEKFIASDYQVNIYRARPVIIVDGNIRQKIMTPYQTAEQIAADAGIKLYPEDITKIDRVKDITDGVGLELVITRATAFSFTLYGKTAIARTQSKTIGEMLVEKGVTLSDEDRVLPIQDRLITSGLSVRVWREGKQTVSVDEAIKFDTEQIQNVDQPVGYFSITTPGVSGLRSVTYEVAIEDGQEVNRIEIASVIITPATKQVEIIGAKHMTFGGTCSEWMASAGISDISGASELIRRESNCNPYSVNPISGACGIGQALPCSKSGCEMGDGACQMIWMNQYVIGRYRTWASALQHSYSYGWY